MTPSASSVVKEHTASVSRRRLGQRSGHLPGRLLLIALAATLVVVSLAGLPYYLSPAAVRLRDPAHAWLRPSGYIGQSAGILGLGIFLFLWLYPARKRFRWLAWTGAVGRWLDIHVAAALLLPLLVGIHAGWRFDGLIGLGFGAILIVWVSGVVGRYLYVRIPRSRSGVEMGREQAMAERRALLTDLAAATGLDPAELERRLHSSGRPGQSRGTLETISMLIRADLDRWRALRRFRTTLRRGTGGGRIDDRAVESVLRLARREAALAGQIRLLDATHRVFRLWHLAHRPVALTALIAVLVHVAVVTALGMTWLR